MTFLTPVFRNWPCFETVAALEHMTITLFYPYDMAAPQVVQNPEEPARPSIPLRFSADIKFETFDTGEFADTMVVD